MYHVSTIRRLSAALLATGILAASATVASAQETVRFGTSGSLSNESIAVSIAIDKGFYEEAGIKAEVINFKGGAPAIQALVGSAIDYCICAPEHVIRLRNRGVDAIVAVPLDNRTGYALLGGSDQNGKTIADLKGGKIGITSSGSKTDNLVRLALQREGLQPDSDVEIVSVGGPGNQLAAIQKGDIAAGMISGFEALRAEQDLPVVHDWRTKRVPNLGLLALEGWIGDHAEISKAVATATLKAAELARSDRALRVETLKKLFPEVRADLIEIGADRLNDSTVITPRFAEDEFNALQADIIELEQDLSPISFAEFNPVPATN